MKMKSDGKKTIIDRKGISLIIFFILWAASSLVMASTLETLLAPRINRSPESLQVFLDQTGSPSLAYARQSTEGPGQLFHLVQKNGLWSSPIAISLPNGNFVALQGVKTLSNGIPLMVFSWDKTNYINLFGITIDLNNPPPPDTPFPMSNSDLEKLMDQNRQLFYSFQVNSAWSAPLPISGTYWPLKAVMETGSDNSVLVVFWRDEDGDSSTVTDEELYALTYFDNHWSAPVRLTTNNRLEYEAQAKFINGKYFVAWSSDQDSNLATKDDKQIFYAVLTKKGTLNTPASPVTPPFTGDGIPAVSLGSFQNTPLLLWMNGGNSHEDPRQTVWESRFGGGEWSAPSATGLKASWFRQGVFHEIDGLSLLLFMDGGILKSALKNENGWSGGETLFSAYKAGLDAGETTFMPDGNQNLLLAILGHVPGGKSEKALDSNDPDGVYAASLPLLPDLAVSSVEDSPIFKSLGKEIQLKITVANKGSLPSGGFTVDLLSQGKLLQTLSGNALNPGREQDLSTTFALNKPSLPLEIEVKPSTPDLNGDNNRTSYLVKILPDYFVHAVTRKDETTVVADIRERKGVAAAPVSVEFSLVEGEQRSIMAQKVFDSNNAVPVEVSWPALAGKKEPFRIEVTVNRERKVTEDDYANNDGSYLFNPLPDFTISAVSVADNQALLTLKNEGEPSAAPVGLMVTDDPLTASSQERPQQGAYYETLSMEGFGQKQVSVNLGNLPGKGDYLYAVVNPDGAVEESNRNNNLARVSRRNTAAFAEGKMEMSNLAESCTAIKAMVSNNGGAPAIYSRVELLNEQGFMIQDRVLSGVNPGESREVEFTSLPKGAYTLQLTDSAQPAFSPSQMTARTGIPKDEVCDGIDNNCNGEVDERLSNCPPAAQTPGQTPSSGSSEPQTPGAGDQPQTPSGGDQPQIPSGEGDQGTDSANSPALPSPSTPGGSLGGGCSLMRPFSP